MPIAKTYLPELIQKLRDLDMTDTAQSGMKELGRQDAANFLKRGYLMLDYHSRRNPKTRAIDWSAYGTQPNHRGSLEEEMGKLHLSPPVRSYFAANAEGVKKEVDNGIKWTVGKCYSGTDREAIFKTVLADVLLNGEKPSKDDPGQPAITAPTWVKWRSRTAATMMMRRQHGPEWQKACQVPVAQPGSPVAGEVQP